MINRLSEDQVRNDFRFENHEQLYRLYRGFKFPNSIKASNRLSFTGEEIMLAGLYKCRPGSGPIGDSEEY